MSVNPGDRFIKVGRPSVIWLVDRIIESGHPIVHVVLVHEGRPDRQITLSMSALEMKSMFTKLEPRHAHSV